MAAGKKFSLISIQLILLVLFANALPGAQKKILVLGFESKIISDVNDSLLRETIMRVLLKGGYESVPLMKTESLTEDRDYRSVRNPKEKDVKFFCKKTGADYAVTGKIAMDRRAGAAVFPRGAYTIEILIYGADGKIVLKKIVSFKGGESLEAFSVNASSAVADAVREVFI